MIIDREIYRVMRTFGKELSRRDKEALLEVLNRSKRHSDAISEAVRLVPMQAVLMVVLLEQEKELEAMLSKLEKIPEETSDLI